MMVEEDEQVFAKFEGKFLQAQTDIESLWTKINNTTGYEFNNKYLLLRAFTHPSYNGAGDHINIDESYERLEFVGDAVLNLMMAKELYFQYPDLNPGQLTRLRAANVDNEKLARAALSHDLYKFLLHCNPLLAQKIEIFSDAIVEYPLHSFGLVDAPKGLADIVESLIGAIYIDSNFSMDTTWKSTKNLLHPIITPTTIQMHPVTRLYEICQKRGFKIDVRDCWKKTGEIEFLIGDQFLGRGKYIPKRVVAYHRAAHDAYLNLFTKLDLDDQQ